MPRGVEQVQAAIEAHSLANIDDYVKTSTMHPELEEAVQHHILLELKSWFFFRKLSCDCARANIALHGFNLLFKRCAIECFADANWLECYLVQRGGICRPVDIPAPTVAFPDDPVDPVQPVYEALRVEKAILEDAIRLCKLADKHGDYPLDDAIETRFLKKETKHVKDMGDLLQQCVRVSKDVGHGVYHLDKELRWKKGITPWAKENNPDNNDLLLKEAAKDLHDPLLYPQ
ncbi:hypothetical protein W97_01359 [Coniosporium apollinis CBS 100218]|uniref:Ferritin n=1 Tax=Coniosporium apollinis (strain CBS 100218) TaxID=1168221 RepID=R7YJS6_CONA1|nr:uncharacterized protein W97_01359 [Coniosporium apollinis CBS 100218]EON62140.1 hypothetical protein W97_01359 [Coniosporium apollinis CBS 100218]